MTLIYSCVRMSPSIALFHRGKLRARGRYPSLEKRGKGRFGVAAAVRPICIVIMLVAYALDQAAAADLTKIYAGYGGIAGYQMPLWVIKEADIGKKYGIDIEPLLISGGALGMQALLANSIQLSQNSASAAIGAAVRGAPIALISTSDKR